MFEFEWELSRDLCDLCPCPRECEACKAGDFEAAPCASEPDEVVFKVVAEVIPGHPGNVAGAPDSWEPPDPDEANIISVTRLDTGAGMGEAFIEMWRDEIEMAALADAREEGYRW